MPLPALPLPLPALPLESLVEQLRNQVTQLRKQSHNKTKCAAYYQGQVTNLRRELADLRATAHETSLFARPGRQGDILWQKLSPLGGYSLAAKRNYGHASCCTISEILEVGSSHKTVSRWERLMAWGLLLRARLFHESMLELFVTRTLEHRHPTQKRAAAGGGLVIGTILSGSNHRTPFPGAGLDLWLDSRF